MPRWQGRWTPHLAPLVSDAFGLLSAGHFEKCLPVPKDGHSDSPRPKWNGPIIWYFTPQHIFHIFGAFKRQQRWLKTLVVNAVVTLYLFFDPQTQFFGISAFAPS
ncbi:hypothetical protein KSP40_PGU019913 [Platanthera guangdongensis]|uniref:Uncharacterized protein n=1 Tax=Platanthera guangdongensis TaxID=2320717 RepID=A0ABR2MFA2_9ASPA